MLHQVLGDDGLHLAPLVEIRLAARRNLPLLDGNRLTPLTTGRQAYDEMLAAIDAAEAVRRPDDLHLRQRRRRASGSSRPWPARTSAASTCACSSTTSASATPCPRSSRALRQHKIRFDTFLPTLIPGQLHYSNLRSHRKILVVDGTLGFTGGMNIRRGHLCEPDDRHPIQDLHFRVEGPVVGQLREIFAYDWEFCHRRAAGSEATWFPPLAPAGQSLCRGIADGPDLDFDKIVLTILGAIGCARHTVDIVTPYFLPEQPLITALNVAAMRGVAVNIILPEKNNLKLVQWACTAQLWQVLQRGCRVWLTPPPFDHSKIMVVDGVWSLVGSANWDPRSLRLNFEFNVECYDRDLAGRADRPSIHAKRAAAREITLAEVDSRPLWRRLRDGVCRLALPYL